MSFAVLFSFGAALREVSFFRRMLMAMGCGACASLAFVPFNIFGVFLLAFPVLYFLINSAASWKQAAGLGWAFAFAHLVINLHWMSGALFVDLASFWWVLPFALCGLPALLALYYGIAATLGWFALSRGFREGPLLLAVLWALADFARAHFFTGLPWNIAGYIWADWLAPLQSVSLIGIEGLTLLTLVAAFAPALFFERGRGRWPHFFAVLCLCLIPAFALWGEVRLSNAETRFVPDVRLRLVQADQTQAMKWRADQRALNFQRLMDATFNEAGGKSVTHYIWPETATSYYLTEEPLVRSAIAARMPRGTSLLTGVVRRDEDGNYYNSLIALDDRGNVVAGYDKHHLVPFGEYMPLRGLLPFPMISAFGSDFTAGPQVQTLRVAGLPPFGPLICYEAIFSGSVAEQQDPPSFLLNVTNDGWYEGTIGPAQHFAMVRPRAIEEGTPLVRVANKGTTAVIDPWGRITAQASTESVGYIDADLPVSDRSATIMQKQQVRHLWLIISILLSLMGCRNRRFLQRNGSKKER